MANRALRRNPTGLPHGGCLCRRAARQELWCLPAHQWCPPTFLARTPGPGTPVTAAIQGTEVVDPRHAQRLREKIGTFQGEVRCVKGTQTGACGEDLCRPATVIENPGHYLINDPRLVPTVSASAFLQRHLLIRPGFGVVAVHAVELDPTSVDEIGHNLDHPPRFEVIRLTHLVRKDQDWTTPMPVCNDCASRSDRR